MNKYHKIFNRSTQQNGGSFAAYCAARTADCGYCGPAAQHWPWALYILLKWQCLHSEGLLLC